MKLVTRIVVIPFSDVFENNAMFKLDSKFNHDSRMVPYNYLYNELSHLGFEIQTFDLYEKLSSSDIYLFFNINDRIYKYFLKYYKNNFILIAQEPLNKNNFTSKNLFKFDRIVTWRSDLVCKDPKYIRNTAYPIVKHNIDWVPLNKRKILVNISIHKKSNENGELYSERYKTILIAEKIFGSQFELYGLRWDKPIDWVERIRRYKTPVSYKGILNNKFSKLIEFKYALCYENNKMLPGNISEKIFDCFQCGVIPLYWGAPDILDFIPEETFIWRERFKSNEDMLRYVSNLTEREVISKQEKIKAFVQSESMNKFWYQHHIQVIIDAILDIHEGL